MSLRQDTAGFFVGSLSKSVAKLSSGERVFRPEEMGQCLEDRHPDHHWVVTYPVRACSDSLGRFLSPSASSPSESTHLCKRGGPVTSLSLSDLASNSATSHFWEESLFRLDLGSPFQVV